MKLRILMIYLFLLGGCTSALTVDRTELAEKTDSSLKVNLIASAINLPEKMVTNKKPGTYEDIVKKSFTDAFYNVERKTFDQKALVVSKVDIKFGVKFGPWEDMTVAVASFFLPPLAAIKNHEAFPFSVKYEAHLPTGEKYVSEEFFGLVSGYFTGWYVGRIGARHRMMIRESEYVGEESARLILNDIYLKFSNPTTAPIAETPKGLAEEEKIVPKGNKIKTEPEPISKKMLEVKVDALDAHNGTEEKLKKIEGLYKKNLISEKEREDLREKVLSDMTE